MNASMGQTDPNHFAFLIRDASQQQLPLLHNARLCQALNAVYAGSNRSSVNRTKLLNHTREFFDNQYFCWSQALPHADKHVYEEGKEPSGGKAEQHGDNVHLVS